MRMIYQWAACIACLTTLSGPSWAGTFEEGFEDILALDDGGWIFDNRSDFVGDASWGQGFPGLFPAQAGPDNSYILGAVGQTGGNVLCDWLILPDVEFFHSHREQCLLIRPLGGGSQSLRRNQHRTLRG